jgi:uncharacterized protein with PIN domain
MRFIADRTLGKLVKWLRILGYDTIYDRGAIGRELLQKGAQENRVVLTRRKDMALRHFRGRMVVIQSDIVVDQIRQVIGDCVLHPAQEKLFSLCVICNEPLKEMSREAVKEKVPAYTFETQKSFHACPCCGSIYWSGTHRENIVSFIAKHNLMDRP